MAPPLFLTTQLNFPLPSPSLRCRVCEPRGSFHRHGALLHVWHRHPYVPVSRAAKKHTLLHAAKRSTHQNAKTFFSSKSPFFSLFFSQERERGGCGGASVSVYYPPICRVSASVHEAPSRPHATRVAGKNTVCEPKPTKCARRTTSYYFLTCNFSPRISNPTHARHVMQCAC